MDLDKFSLRGKDTQLRGRRASACVMTAQSRNVTRFKIKSYLTRETNILARDGANDTD